MASEIIFLTVPIGNLSDITKRVSDALVEGKKFIVEDSRVFLSLLSALEIPSDHKEWVIWHDHTDQNVLRKVKSWINHKEKIYVVSDAGSPVLSDPAYDLLLALKEEHFILDSYGGVTSVIQALELSQLPPIPFHFHGFLARNNQDCIEQIQQIMNIKGTHIYFLSPHRVLETLGAIVGVLPGIKMVLARELTKKLQEVISFTSNDWPTLQETLTIKGEFVFLFYISENKHNTLAHDKLNQLAKEYLSHQKPKMLAKLLSEITGMKVSDVYNQLHTDKNS